MHQRLTYLVTSCFLITNPTTLIVTSSGFVRMIIEERGERKETVPPHYKHTVSQENRMELPSSKESISWLAPPFK